MGLGQLSDKWGRKWLIVFGMWLQAAGIIMMVISSTMAGWLLAAFLLGLGTAMVYPTLLAAVSDVAHPVWRGSAVGVYRLWRDLGFAVGAILAGLLADLFNIPVAILTIGGLTFISGLIVATVMYETLPARTAVATSRWYRRTISSLSLPPLPKWQRPSRKRLIVRCRRECTTVMASGR
ncbi:MAG: MFS transporter [Pseudomonadota bacterium]